MSSNFEQELYYQLSKRFPSVKFVGNYDFDDDAWYITAIGEDVEKFRIGSEDTRTKSFEDIVAEAIAHFESGEEE